MTMNSFSSARHARNRSGIRVGYNWFWEESEGGTRLPWTFAMEQFGAMPGLSLGG